jgi:hypothetical protein
MQQLIADTLDDLLLKVYPKILRNGERVKASKGWNRELSGVILELTNPLARLSRTETKGTVFSCLGETLWYFGFRVGRYPAKFLHILQRQFIKPGLPRGGISGALEARYLIPIVSFSREPKFLRSPNTIGEESGDVPSDRFLSTDQSFDPVKRVVE